MSIDNIKILLSLEDDSQDGILTVLLDNTISSILVYLEVDELPPQLAYIAEEIVVKKYRRLGNEGVQSEKIDVLTTTFNSSRYLDEYIPYLELYKKNTLKKNKKLRLL